MSESQHSTAPSLALFPADFWFVPPQFPAIWAPGSLLCFFPDSSLHLWCLQCMCDDPSKPQASQFLAHPSSCNLDLHPTSVFRSLTMFFFFLSISHNVNFMHPTLYLPLPVFLSDDPQMSEPPVLPSPFRGPLCLTIRTSLCPRL